MDEMLKLITDLFTQYCRDHNIRGLSDICVDPADGYFNVRVGEEVYARLSTDTEIRCRTVKETSTTEEE